MKTWNVAHGVDTRQASLFVCSVNHRASRGLPLLARFIYLSLSMCLSLPLVSPFVSRFPIHLKGESKKPRRHPRGTNFCSRKNIFPTTNARRGVRAGGRPCNGNRNAESVYIYIYIYTDTHFFSLARIARNVSLRID